jgi:glycosyltransferase involved in cell wall biosynthesis
MPAPILTLSRSLQSEQIAGHANRAEYQLHARLARRRRVLQLERPFQLATLARPTREKLEQLAHAVGPARPGAHNMPVLQPLAWWLREGDRRAWRINIPLYRPWLHRALKILAEPPIVWVYDYRYWPLLDGLPRAGAIYHCTEDYAGIVGGAYGQADAAWVVAQERALLERVDTVFAVSEGLADTWRPHHPDVRLLRNSVDTDLYRPDAPCVPACAGIAHLPRPVLGYVGEVGPKVDYALVDRLAARFPNGSVALIGRQNGMADDDAFRRATAHPNVHLLGHQPPEALPALTAHMDVALIPYKTTDWIVNVLQPIKTFEYLACDRPVVSSWLPNLLPWRDVIALCRDQDEFLAACASALDARSAALTARRLAVAHENSWPARAEDAEAAMRGIEARPGGPGRTGR